MLSINVKRYFYEILDNYQSKRCCKQGSREVPIQPSAFESEIHPPHKTSFCTPGDFAIASSLRINITMATFEELIVADEKKEMIAMPRHSFIQMTKLHNVMGRIDYITSTVKQENLYAIYATQPLRSFWKDLAKCNREEFTKSGTTGKCIEARELIIALPEALYHYEHDYLIKHFATDFKKKYGVDCYAALHHNKRKTNFHIHLIFAERTKLEKLVVKVASRNMFYDESGKHVRTKKEILDESGDIRNGCKIIRKGEVYAHKG